VVAILATENEENVHRFIPFARWVYNWIEIIIPGAGALAGVGALGIGLDVDWLAFAGFILALGILATTSATMFLVLKITLIGLDQIGLPTVLDRHNNVSGRDQEGDQRGT
jgi:hypothetical protein